MTFWGWGRDSAVNGSWLGQQLESIKEGVNKLGIEMAAMNQEMKTVHSEQSRLDERVKMLEGLVKDIKENEIKQSAKWSGPKTVMATLATSAPIIGALFYLIQIWGAQ